MDFQVGPVAIAVQACAAVIGKVRTRAARSQARRAHRQCHMGGDDGKPVCAGGELSPASARSEADAGSSGS